MSLEERLTRLGTEVEGMIERWLAEFEERPLKAGLKVLIVLYLVRWARRNLL